MYLMFKVKIFKLQLLKNYTANPVIPPDPNSSFPHFLGIIVQSGVYFQKKLTWKKILRW